MKHLNKPRALLFLAVLACALAPARSSAALYVETGVGGGQFLHAAPTFPSLANPSGFGLGTNVTFANAFGSANALVQIHLGIQHRMTEVGSGGTTYGLMSLYPLVRFETPRMYFGLGASPLIYTTQNTSGSFISGYQKDKGSVGYLGEAGLLWRVVPYFHLAIVGSAEAISHGGTLGPSPALQISLNLRFFLGDGQSRGSGSSSRKYDGWRYPFGIELF